MTASSRCPFSKGSIHHQGLLFWRVMESSSREQVSNYQEHPPPLNSFVSRHPPCLGQANSLPSRSPDTWDLKRDLSSALSGSGARGLRVMLDVDTSAWARVCGACVVGRQPAGGRGAGGSLGVPSLEPGTCCRYLLMKPLTSLSQDRGHDTGLGFSHQTAEVRVTDLHTGR